MIAAFWGKCKGVLDSLDREDIFVVLLIVLVGTASFGLGRLSKQVQVREPARIETKRPSEEGSPNVEGAVTVEGGYVASKNGTKYHFPWCSGAQNIKEENKIWFESGEEAEAAGYTPAANCPGL